MMAQEMLGEIPFRFFSVEIIVHSLTVYSLIIPFWDTVHVNFSLLRLIDSAENGLSL